MDTDTLLFWIAVNLFSLLALSAYSMLEMACISFDRVRLQYFLTKGDHKMQWLNKLVTHSGTLFGTTLIGVNIALVVGSESARQIVASFGISPELSAIPQALVVILFGELAPMFAARRYPDHVVRLGIGLVYYSAKLLTPILWLINSFTTFITRLFGAHKGHHETFLGREELQKMLEVHEEPTIEESADMSQTISNIFTIGSKTAASIMHPLKELQLIPSNCTAGELRKIALKTKQYFYPIRQEKTLDVVGIVYPRDLLRIADNRRVRDYARQPWFVDNSLRVLDLLKQFRSNHESLAIVVDRRGKTAGFLTLDHIIESIIVQPEEESRASAMVIVDRTVDPNCTVAEIETEVGIHLPLPKELIFAEYCKEKLENHPHVGDTFTLDHYEVTVLETSVFEILKVKIKTKLF